MTFDYNLNSYYFNKKSNTSFESPFSEDVYNDILNAYKLVLNKRFVNGICTRLDNCEDVEGKTVLTISPIRFFDYLLTNLLYLNYNLLIEHISDKNKSQVNDFYYGLLMNNEPNSFSDILEIRQLSNLFAISCVITDGNNYLITKRNDHVGIANNYISTSVTGSIDDQDFKKNDPILSCCKREINEELGLTIQDNDMTVRRIVCGSDKFQPSALVDVKVNDLNVAINRINDKTHFFEENCGIFLYTKKEIVELLENQTVPLTETARTHLKIVTL